MKTQISFEDYSKVEMRVGEIVGAEVPEGSKKLIRFEVDFGDEQRVIFSGIKEWYEASELVGVKTTWVTNIPSRKTPFGESQGMLLAVDDKKGKPYLIKIGDEVENGSEFH